MPTRAMVIVGGGSSARFGSDKLMVDIHGRPLIQLTVERIVPHVDRCVLVVREAMVDRVSALGLAVTVTAGGRTRTLSEMAGLGVVGADYDLIGIHDAARPLLSATLIEELFGTAERVGGAVPLLKSDELIVDRRTHKPVPGLKRAQTPQVFKAEPLLAAYVGAAQSGFEGYDTVEIVQRFTDLEIASIAGDPTNLKVTFPDDVESVRSGIRT